MKTAVLLWVLLAGTTEPTLVQVTITDHCPDRQYLVAHVRQVLKRKGLTGRAMVECHRLTGREMML